MVTWTSFGHSVSTIWVSIGTWKHFIFGERKGAHLHLIRNWTKGSTYFEISWQGEHLIGLFKSTSPKVPMGACCYELTILLDWGLLLVGNGVHHSFKSLLSSLSFSTITLIGRGLLFSKSHKFCNGCVRSYQAKLFGWSRNKIQSLECPSSPNVGIKCHVCVLGW